MTVISQMACIRGWAGGRGAGGVAGVGGKPKAGNPTIKRQTVVECVQ